jgi:broad specificity phosphatase PhoE
MKLYVARHGRTKFNDLGLCNGDPSTDNPLTEKGEQQARSLAESLRQVDLKHIYVSEMKRTQQTAAPVNEYHHVPVTIDPLLNDIRTAFEGKPASEYNAALDAAEDRYTARPGGGESIEDVKTRVAAFIDTLRQQPYETVLVVTSEIIVQAFCAVLNNISNQEAEKVVVGQGTFIEFDLR